MKKIILSVFILSTSCCIELANKTTTVKILSWNLQNLFNDIDEGGEYSEFTVSSGNWNSLLYETRLSNICKILELNNPDIIALQEVENESVLLDLKKKLSGYNYYAVTNSKSSIQQGFLSKYQIISTSYIDPNNNGSNLRDILEVTISIDSSELVLINNHWKSKLGGYTEGYRLQSSYVLEKRVLELSNKEIIVLGDFNENYNEYQLIHKSYNTGLMFNSEGFGLNITDKTPKNDSELYTVWPNSNFNGSYLYLGKWETIDNFMLNKTLMEKGGFTFSSFYVDTRSILFSSSGKIKKWYSDFATGYSDHLPIILELERVGVKTTLE